MPRTEADARHMAHALRLARKGLGCTSPNPAVGAVIVKNGRVIGKGYHRKAGCPHAEIEAMRNSRSPLEGSTLYVTLEPCCHYGRTPPCTKAIIEAGINRVVAAMEDPNPLVSGKGLRELRKAGIKTEVGLMGGEAGKLNEHFIKYITTGMPFVTSKVAMTLDGKIATSTGNSRWITGEKSRELVHELRRRYDAILAGAGTILKDNPSLTARAKGKSESFPVRVIVDGRLRTPASAKVLNLPGRAMIATTRSARGKKIRMLEKKGVTILRLPGKKGRVSLKSLFRSLGKLGITSVLSEGGSEMNGSLLSEGLADKFLFFIAPTLMGGQGSLSAFGGKGPKKASGARKLRITSIKKTGRDLLVEATAA